MTEHTTEQVRTCFSSYETLQSALADYYDMEGAFAPYTPITEALLSFSRRSGITTTEALEQLYELYGKRNSNRL